MRKCSALAGKRLCVMALAAMFLWAGASWTATHGDVAGSGGATAMEPGAVPGDEVCGSGPTVHWSKMASPPAQILAHTSVTLADINLDGHTDIVAGYDNMGIHIWLGDSQGGWTSFPSPTSQGQYNDIAVGDINNDGKLDIVGASGTGLYAWTGDGQGAWTSVTLATGGVTGQFYSVALGDVNLNGRTDIVAGTFGQVIRKAIQVFLNTPSGWIRGDTNLPTSGEYRDIALGDFNRDGKLDIAAAGNAGVRAWSGDGAGSWALRNNGLPTSGTYSGVRLADFNRDGKLDLAAASGANGGVMVWDGDGQGIWTLTFNDLPTTGTYHGVEVADINLDGCPDILTASSDSGNRIWSGDGQGNWYPQTDGLEAGMYHTAISSGDITRDARTDMCLINSTGFIEVWKCSVDRPFNKWTEFPAPATSGTVNDVLIWDVNMDGKPDIAYAFESKGIEIWTGDGKGTWTAFTSPATTGNYNALAAADFNNDGKPDLVATSDTGVRAWTGNGAGTWTARNTGLPSSSIYLGLSVSDLNNDGKPDMAVGSGSNSGITVFNGDAQGIWTMTFTSLPSTGNFHSIAARDMNNDGWKDLVAADGGIRQFLGGASDWTESSAGLPGVSSGYNSVNAMDADRDAGPEIIGASPAGTTVWKADGSGTWALDATVTSSGSLGLAGADFNLDGYSDLCIGSDAGIRAFSNLAGWADESAGLQASGTFAAMRMADINLDGMPDIITFDNSAQAPRIWIADYEPPPVSDIALRAGWNLVSIPMVQNDTAVETVLASIAGQWDVVKHYDGITKTWKTYRVGSSVNTLLNIDHTMGFWLRALQNTTLTVGGMHPEDTDILLRAGWNLVGYPSKSALPASNTLPAVADTVAIWQAETPYIRDYTDKAAVIMSAGNGYWVHVSAETVWTVEW